MAGLDRSGLGEARVRRLAGADYAAWVRQVARVGGCAHPVRIRGAAHAVDLATGDVLGTFTSSDQPDGTVLLPCGDRRESVCPTCAATYRRDSWYLVAAGLRGGDLAVELPTSRGVASAGGLPSLVGHPMVFATFTAPSFGPVHRWREGKPCRPRRRGGTCEHLVPLGCTSWHGEHDAAVGAPICGDCYAYEAAVLWNAHVPALWDRTVFAAYSALARLGSALAGVRLTVRGVRKTVRMAYAKVAEWQVRGAVHLHVVARLDGVDPGDADRVVPPPAWASAELLGDVLTEAADTAAVSLPAVDPVWPVACWGGRFDVQPVTGDEVGGFAAYLAKYATKAAGDTLGGLPIRRMGALDVAVLRSGRGRVSDHGRRLALTAVDLSEHAACGGLRLAENAHQAGYRGHFMTRSRRYSSTRKALREARRRWSAEETRRTGVPGDPWVMAADRDDVAVVGDWSYVGTGYASLADGEIAASLAEQWQQAARERRETGGAERLSMRNGPGPWPNRVARG